MRRNNFDEEIMFVDKVFKPLLLLSVLVIVVMVGIGVRQVFITTQKLNDSTQDIKQSTACMVSLFTQPDRTHLTIKDVTACTLERQ